jgi:Cdc6-like AAA superfamily ATPase
MPASTKQQSQSKSYYEVPLSEVSYYVERPELLMAINNGFSDAAERSPRPKRVVLLGMGGQGKTQLALEYCRRTRTSLYKAIFWVDASSSNTATQGFASIASKISNPGRMFDSYESMIEFVKGTLSTWEEPWLMVFDHYDSPDELKNISDYFPQGEAGAILLTSRHAGSQRLGTTIWLTRMTERESLELLLRRSNHEMNNANIEEGLKIVKIFAYLPLAIDQAAAYIYQRKLPLSQFIKHYEDQKEYILKHTPSLWEYRGHFGNSANVFTTWELSFQQIGKNDNDRNMIGHFLTLSAFLNASDVGEDLIRFSLT